jgi:hypothetical protein
MLIDAVNWLSKAAMASTCLPASASLTRASSLTTAEPALEVSGSEPDLVAREGRVDSVAESMCSKVVAAASAAAAAKVPAAGDCFAAAAAAKVPAAGTCMLFTATTESFAIGAAEAVAEVAALASGAAGSDADGSSY